VTIPPELHSDDIETLRSALAAAHAARLEAEARASGAEAMVERLKLLIATYKRDKFGPSSERARHLDQLELQLEELEATAAEDALAAEAAARKAAASSVVRSFASAASRYAHPCRRICRASAS
jgi:transposase